MTDSQEAPTTSPEADAVVSYFESLNYQEQSELLMEISGRMAKHDPSKTLRDIAFVIRHLHNVEPAPPEPKKSASQMVRELSGLVDELFSMVLILKSAEWDNYAPDIDSVTVQGYAKAMDRLLNPCMDLVMELLHHPELKHHEEEAA